MPKFKLNILEWIRSRLMRRCDQEHVITVIVYDNGRRVFTHRKIEPNLLVKENLSFLDVMSSANSVVSQVYGEEKKLQKLRCRGKASL